MLMAMDGSKQIMADHPYCMACGRGPEESHREWIGKWSIVVSAVFVGMETDMREGMIVLCSRCNHLRNRDGGVATVYGQPDVAISDDNAVWLKMHRDAKYYDERFLRRMGLRLLSPLQPCWLESEYVKRRGQLVEEDRVPISDLESFGLSQRSILILESQGGFMWVDELRRAGKSGLAEIPSVGEKTVASVMKAIKAMDSGKTPSHTTAIEEACRRVQDGWTDEVRQRRSVLPKQESWSVPEVQWVELEDEDEWL